MYAICLSVLFVPMQQNVLLGNGPISECLVDRNAIVYHMLRDYRGMANIRVSPILRHPSQRFWQTSHLASLRRYSLAFSPNDALGKHKVIGNAKSFWWNDIHMCKPLPPLSITPSSLAPCSLAKPNMQRRCTSLLPRYPSRSSACSSSLLPSSPLL